MSKMIEIKSERQIQLGATTVLCALDSGPRFFAAHVGTREESLWLISAKGDVMLWRPGKDIVKTASIIEEAFQCMDAALDEHGDLSIIGDAGNIHRLQRSANGSIHLEPVSNLEGVTRDMELFLGKTFLTALPRSRRGGIEEMYLYEIASGKDVCSLKLPNAGSGHTPAWNVHASANRIALWTSEGEVHRLYIQEYENGKKTRAECKAKEDLLRLIHHAESTRGPTAGLKLLESMDHMQHFEKLLETVCVRTVRKIDAWYKPWMGT